MFRKISFLEQSCLPQCLKKRITLGTGWRGLESGLFSTGSCLIVTYWVFFCVAFIGVCLTLVPVEEDISFCFSSFVNS